MSGVFISYRRADAAGWARSVHDRLAREFGRSRVFIDVDDIPPGDDFTEVITERMRRIDAVVVLIGPRWTSLAGEDGTPRLHDPDDLLRREIAIALLLGVRVIPVLVAGAAMPRADELPEDLRPLARVNAVELSPTRFDAQVEQLVTAVGDVLPRRLSTVVAWTQDHVLLGISAVVVLIVVVGVVVVSQWSSSPPVDTTPPVAPMGLTAIAGDGEVTLDWDDSAETDLASYAVSRAATSGGPYTSVATGLTTSAYLDGTAANDTTYYYVVNATDTADNTSANSAQASATPTSGEPPVDTTPPVAPTGLTATAGDGEVTLDWDDSSTTDLGSYAVFRAATSGGPYTSIATGLTTSAYVDDTAANDTTYYYVVNATDTADNTSANSAQAFATPEAPRPTVFFIHDQPLAFTFLSADLEFSGVEVTIYASISEAQAAIVANRPDVAVLSVRTNARDPEWDDQKALDFVPWLQEQSPETAAIVALPDVEEVQDQLLSLGAVDACGGAANTVTCVEEAIEDQLGLSVRDHPTQATVRESATVDLRARVEGTLVALETEGVLASWSRSFDRDNHYSIETSSGLTVSMVAESVDERTNQFSVGATNAATIGRAEEAEAWIFVSDFVVALNGGVHISGACVIRAQDLGTYLRSPGAWPAYYFEYGLADGEPVTCS